MSSLNIDPSIPENENENEIEIETNKEINTNKPH